MATHIVIDIKVETIQKGKWRIFKRFWNVYMKEIRIEIVKERITFSS